MNNEDILNLLRPILAKAVDRDDPSTITAETSFDELGLTSVEIVDLLTAVEAKLAIRVPGEKLIDVVSVGDLLEHVRDALAQKA
jgi:acyl carrier protein